MSVRPWLRLVLALATIFVASIVSPGLGRAQLAGVAIEIAAAHCADGQATPTRDRHLHDRPGCPPSDLEAADSDLDDDDDDDTVGHGTHHAPPTSRSVPAPRQPEPTRRAERAIDTSRFTAGIGHPRGPPAV